MIRITPMDCKQRSSSIGNSGKDLIFLGLLEFKLVISQTLLLKVYSLISYSGRSFNYQNQFGIKHLHDRCTAYIYHTIYKKKNKSFKLLFEECTLQPIFGQNNFTHIILSSCGFVFCLFVCLFVWFFFCISVFVKSRVNRWKILSKI